MNLKRLLIAGMKYTFSPDYRFLINASCGKYDKMEDRIFLEKKYKATVQEKLNIENPETFCEKLQWLKLYNRKPELTKMVDKYQVRELVAQKLGEDVLVPLLGVWESAEDIDFDSLPNQFVLKCNHNSGLGMCICKDKSLLNIPKVKKALDAGLKQDYYLTGREWPYKNVPRKIIAETFLSDGVNAELQDYKFFCFNGEPRLCQVITDRSTDEKIDFYDMEWNHVELTGLHNRWQMYGSAHPVNKPETFGQMKEAAKVLCQHLPFVRVDFYEVKGKMYFGELTFYPASGFGVFSPDSWNKTLGSWIDLPEE